MSTPSNPLDDTKKIFQLDKFQMAETISQLDKQLVQTAKGLKNWQPGQNFSNLESIVTIAMGGSGLGAHFVASLFSDELKLPYVIVNDYNLPEFVGKNSLVFLISYSGQTREILEAGKQVLARKSKIIVITTGGELAEFAKKSKLPNWVFKPEANFCNQPRMGLGYLILGQILILQKLGLIKIGNNELDRILQATKKAILKWEIGVKIAKNLAKRVASEIYGKIPVIVAAQFLIGNAHIMSNQLNENAKQASFWLPIPEATHHFLESLTTSQAKDNLVLINLKSEFYDDEIKKRFEITKELAIENQVRVIDIQLETLIPLEECFSMLVLSSWTSFYLAILHNLDPTPIPTVEFFKTELAKSPQTNTQ